MRRLAPTARRLAAALLVVAGLSCAGAPGPPTVVSLAGPWSFQPGDDPAWAEPGFNSSGWAAVQVPMSWGRQGFDHVTGLAWYRLRVTGPWAADEILGVQLGEIESAYEAFVGGRKVGGRGRMPPDPAADYDRHLLVAVPPGLREPDGSILLALRVWRAPGSAAGAAGLVEGTYAVGPLTEMAQRAASAEVVPLALVFVFLVATVYHLGLLLLQRDARAYGWFSLLSAEAAAYSFLRTQWKYQVFGDAVLMEKAEYVVLCATMATFAQFLWMFFREPFPAHVRVAQAALVSIAVVSLAWPDLRAVHVLLPVLYVVLAALALASFSMIAARVRAGDREARAVGVAAVIAAFAVFSDAMVDRSLYIAPRLGAYGFGALVVGMRLTLAYRFHRALEDVEGLRRGLEERVQTRTEELSAAYRRMEELALRDGLTGLLNRRALTDQALAGLSRATRRRQPFAVAMVDIDRFKSINDTHGHGAGDQVLVQLALLLTSAVRASDAVGRWGGEEFLVLLPESDRTQCATAAERLRQLIEASPMRIDGEIDLAVTVSVGVAVVDDAAATPVALDALIGAADDALYRAKDGGRNRVEVAGAPQARVTPGGSD